MAEMDSKSPKKTLNELVKIRKWKIEPKKPRTMKNSRIMVRLSIVLRYLKSEKPIILQVRL